MAPADPSSESDSGVSEDSPVAPATALPSATVYQVVYDISGLGGAKPGPADDNVISIELGKPSGKTGSVAEKPEEPAAAGTAEEVLSSPAGQNRLDCSGSRDL